VSAICGSCRFWVRHASEEPLTGMCRSLRLRKDARRDLALQPAPMGGSTPPYVITWQDDTCEFFTARPAEVNDAAEGD
jgi:hypothetical protein